MSVMNKLIARAKGLVLNSNKPVSDISSWRVPNPRDSDIYIVSYPKSGNTWMRYLLAYSIWPELQEVDLVEMASYIPSYGIKHDMEVMLKENTPCNQLKHRLIKEHTTYNDLARKYIKRAIYIVRDGRDVMVSYWHFCNQRDGTAIPFSDFITLSAKPGLSYGPWKEHVSGWMDAPLDTKLILRYEDMLLDTAGCLKRALKFAEIDASEEAVFNAVKRASFNSMRQLEKTKGLNLDQLKNVDFVREGKIGAWKSTFGPGDLDRFNHAHGGCIPELDYKW